MKDTRDKRVIRTQTALLEALEIMVQKKKLTNITITDLCIQANINRNTFYYHYNNICEFLKEHQQIVIGDMSQILEKPVSNKENLVELFESLRRHPHFLNILSSPNCDMDLFSDIFTTATRITQLFVADVNSCKNQREKYLSIYCNEGCNAVIRTWILSGMVESPREIANIIWDASTEGPFTLTKTN